MSELIALAMIACNTCPAFAATVILQRGDAGIEVIRRSFVGTLTQKVNEAQAVAIRAALDADFSAPALYALDPELAPFWCPQCGQSYCGAHWQTELVWDEDLPDWLDSIRGRCPAGHERMLDD